MNNFFNKNDDELFLLLKQNHASALKVLFEKYFYSLCNFSISYVKSVDLAEEVVSDIFLNIWLNRNTISIRTNLKSYLFTAVRNRSLNYVTKEKRDWENLEIVDKEITSDNSPYEVLSYKELENVIDSFIKKLQ